MSPSGRTHIQFKFGNTIYIYPQLPLDLDGHLVGAGNAAEQAEQVFTNLQNVLKAVGTNFWMMSSSLPPICWISVIGLL